MLKVRFGLTCMRRSMRRACKQAVILDDVAATAAIRSLARPTANGKRSLRRLVGAYTHE